MQGHARQHRQRVILLQRHHLKGVVRGPWAEQDLHPEALWAIYGDPVRCSDTDVSRAFCSRRCLLHLQDST